MSVRVRRPGRTSVAPVAPAAWLVGAAVAVVLGLAAAVRLWRLDLTVYEVDEAAVLRLAEDLVRLGRVPLSGPVLSAGIPSAPHFVYLLAPVVALSREPDFAAGAIGVANVLGIGATIWLGQRAFGWPAALLGGVLYAVGPFAVFYARRIWQPDVLPPLAVLLFVALDLGIVGRRAGWAAATFPLVALGTLVHPSFATLAPMLLAPAALLLAWRRWLALGAGLLLAALIALPTLVHEVQTRWVDVADLRYFTSLHTWVNLDALEYAVALASGWAAPIDPAVPPADHALPRGLVQAGAGLELLLLAFGLGVALLGLRPRAGETGDRTRRLRLAALVIWLVGPVVLTLRHSVPLQAHYFLASAPAMFLALGVGAAWLVQRGGLARLAGGTVVAAIVAIQVASVVRSLAVVAATDACYGPPLLTAQTLEAEAVSLGQRNGATRAAVELPADDALPIGYLLRSTYPEIDLARAGPFGLGRAGAPTRPPSLPSGVAPVLGPSEQQNRPLPDGFRLIEAALSTRAWGGQRQGLALVWQVDEAATTNHPHVWQVRLLDAAGRAVFEQPGVDHVPAALRGQRVVSWFTIDPAHDEPIVLPPGSYQVVLRLLDTWAPAVLGEPISVGSVNVEAPIRCVA